jgi:hypothetical protein
MDLIDRVKNIASIIPKELKHTLLLLLYIFVSTGVVGCGKSGPSKTWALVMCEPFVENRLKSPSTADFSSIVDSTVTDYGGGRYKVVAYVYASNSFGVKTRNNYTCIIRSVGDKWQLESLKMHDY